MHGQQNVLICVFNYTSSSASTTQHQNIKSVNVHCEQSRGISLFEVVICTVSLRKRRR